MIGQCIRWIKRFDPSSPRPAALPAPTAPVPLLDAAAEDGDTNKRIEIRGHADGWLRILRSRELLNQVRGERALELMWRQSRLSALVWRRDLLPALHRYAEYVQLMPASESHHHAHAGGLLAHTLEVTLAAMTWRNGHFFPEGAPVEEMDAQRDEWTYVMFFGALLHDIGKIMTDLRVSWTAQGMDSPLRWVPMSGPLTETSQLRAGGEYLVEFTPKSARDYQAHSKLSMILLQQIAPSTALSFLARRPQAFDALSQYLAGADKSSLLANTIRKADQASTQKALASGNRARFTTSSSVPLIDLLMQSIKDMLRSGTALPLNRSGAAGWVFEGAIWFVAKRLADGVRQHIKNHHPDESIPGENKNDRLFDTWQEYGCIQLNPQSGQAVWYVQVQGGAEPTSDEQDTDENGNSGEGGATYTHSLTMLRFPLDKLFEDVAQYPPPMVGRILIQQKRVAAPSDRTETGAIEMPSREEDSSRAPETPESPETSPDKSEKRNGLPAQSHEVEATSAPAPGANKGFRAKAEPVLRAPSFGKPKAATTKAPKASSSTPPNNQATAATRSDPTDPSSFDLEPLQMGGPDGFNAKEKWLDFEDDAGLFKEPAKPAPRAKEPAVVARAAASQAPAPITPKRPKTATKAPPEKVEAPAPSTAPLPSMPEPPDRRPLLVRSGQAAMSERTQPLHRLQHVPVVLTPFLPELPHETAGKQVEPTATAMAFITWLQQGLASRDLKYNETGAMIHFVPEGMALVSPLVFKAFVADQELNDSGAEAQALQVQREVIKAGWHLMGPGKSNILKYQVLGRGSVPVGKLSAIVLIRPERWVVPVPPINPVLRMD